VPDTGDNTDWELMSRIAKSMAPLVKTHLLKEWQPYGKGHGLVAMECIFELFSDGDWRGFVSFLPFLIPKQVATGRGK
jgi:hypothetical protein